MRAVGARGWAIVSRFIARSVFAWALPRPSAIASAKLANRTVNHSQSAIGGREELAFVAVAEELVEEQHVVMTAPISTTSMTGLPSRCSGFSLTNESMRRLAR